MIHLSYSFVDASLPEARELPDYMEKILEKISKVIGGTIVVEDDVFCLGVR